MATYIEGQTFYGKEVVEPSPLKWPEKVNTEDQAPNLKINPQGLVSTQLEATYANALKASKLRLIRMGLPNITITELNNYKNLVYLLLTISYNNGEEKQYTVVNLSEAMRSYSPTGKFLNLSQIIEMKNYDLDSCTIALINKSDQPITVNYVRVYRSQDIAASQIGEAIGWGVTLREVKAYSDGCKLYYEGSTIPDNIWYIEKDGQFAGLNINNERIINFSRINEPLVDDEG